MSVLQPDRIDLLELDEADNTLWLTMVEERRWSEVDPSWKSLQDKLDFAASAKTGVRLRAVPSRSSTLTDTVVGVLVQMGYKRSEAEAAVGSATEASSSENVEGLLRSALSALS